MSDLSEVPPSVTGNTVTWLRAVVELDRLLTLQWHTLKSINRNNNYDHKANNGGYANKFFL